MRKPHVYACVACILSVCVRLQRYVFIRACFALSLSPCSFSPKLSGGLCTGSCQCPAPTRPPCREGSAPPHPGQRGMAGWELLRRTSTWRAQFTSRTAGARGGASSLHCDRGRVGRGERGVLRFCRSGGAPVVSEASCFGATPLRWRRPRGNGVRPGAALGHGLGQAGAGRRRRNSSELCEHCVSSSSLSQQYSLQRSEARSKTLSARRKQQV